MKTNSNNTGSLADIMRAKSAKKKRQPRWLTVPGHAGVAVVSPNGKITQRLT